jgi:hypothetical protein
LKLSFGSPVSRLNELLSACQKPTLDLDSDYVGYCINALGRHSDGVDLTTFS